MYIYIYIYIYVYIYIYLSQSHFLIIVSSRNSLPTCCDISS